MKNNFKMSAPNGSTKGVLFLVPSDALSQVVRRVAKRTGLELTIVTLGVEEASLQRTPLPMLLMDGYSYGPASLYDFLKSERDK